MYLPDCLQGPPNLPILPEKRVALKQRNATYNKMFQYLSNQFSQASYLILPFETDAITLFSVQSTFLHNWKDCLNISGSSLKIRSEFQTV